MEVQTDVDSGTQASAPINTSRCDVKGAQRGMMGHTTKSQNDPPPPEGGFYMTKTLKEVPTSCDEVRLSWR